MYKKSKNKVKIKVGYLFILIYTNEKLKKLFIKMTTYKVLGTSKSMPYFLKK